MKTLAAWALALLFTAPAAHALDRPGLHLARGQRLLIDGDLDGAEAEARRVLAAWPNAARARLLLAQVARARGDEATAQRLIAAVEATGARLARLEAQRLRAPASAPLRLHLALGGQLDTRAVSTPDQSLLTTTLAEARPDMADMRSIVILGNSATRRVGAWVYTPRSVPRSSP